MLSLRAIDAARERGGGLPVIAPAARGRPLRQQRIRELADGPGAIFLCGRYEGIDERVLEARNVEEVSVGDFVVSGGELPAMALLDAVVRLLPKAIGNPESVAEESFSAGLLEYPQYTRPAEWEGRSVPEALRSGHHGRIRAWREGNGGTRDAREAARSLGGLRCASGRRLCGVGTMNLMEEIESKEVEALMEGRQIPEFSPGDTVRVGVRVVEGEKTRVQAFEGVCIARKGGGLNASFTVRKISGGEGVERVFPLHAPVIDSITVIRRGSRATGKIVLFARANRKGRAHSREDYAAQPGQERQGLITVSQARA